MVEDKRYKLIRYKICYGIKYVMRLYWTSWDIEPIFYNNYKLL